MLNCRTEKIENAWGRLSAVDVMRKRERSLTAVGTNGLQGENVMEEGEDDRTKNGILDGTSSWVAIDVADDVGCTRGVEVRADSITDIMDLTVSNSGGEKADLNSVLMRKVCAGKQTVPALLMDYVSDASVIDLSVSDDEMSSEDVVWGGEASAEDIVQINKMLRSGVGVFGSISSKLVVKESLLEGAGKGVFIKEGCVIRNGECITQYSGRTVRSIRGLSVKEQLRTIEIDGIFVVGEERLTEGDGFGSLVNSSVVGRTLSFCRFVSYKNSVYIMAHCKKSEYPLRGSMELYLTAGSGWWSLFNSVRDKS